MGGLGDMGLLGKARVGLGATALEHEAFFREMLADVDETTTPFGLTDVRGDGREIGEVRETLSEGLSQRLRSRARSLGVSPASLFHLAWALVLSRTTGRPDWPFAPPLFGRPPRCL